MTSQSTVSENLRVVASLNPFSVATADLELPPGGTVLDLMLAAGCHRAFLGGAHVFIIDRGMTEEPIYITRENWARVRPKPGMHISIRVVPTGGGGGSGGKNPLRTVLTIAVMVAAFAVPAAAAAGVFGEGLKAFALSGNLFGKFYLGSAALAIGTPIIGPVAINSTAPPPP